MIKTVLITLLASETRPFRCLLLPGPKHTWCPTRVLNNKYLQLTISPLPASKVHSCVRKSPRVNLRLPRTDVWKVRIVRSRPYSSAKPQKIYIGCSMHWEA